MAVDYLRCINAQISALSLDLPLEQREKLAQYCAEVERWNRKINLTSLSNGELVRRLVIEPVWIAKQLNPTGVLVDIGSGNGSPAIPIHLTSRLTTTHLMEARLKRAVFLRHVASTLGLISVRVHRSRYEDVCAGLGQVDWITLQGVALTADLLAAMQNAASTTTTVVWVTLGPPPVVPSAELVLPFTKTRVLLFTIGPVLT